MTMFAMLRKLFGGTAPAEKYPPGGGPDGDGSRYVENTDGGRLYIEMKKWCPDCHHCPQYYQGPSGGISTNVFCGNCGQGYNITPMVETAERIGKN